MRRGLRAASRTKQDFALQSIASPRNHSEARMLCDSPFCFPDTLIQCIDVFDKGNRFKWLTEFESVF
jgi:hypothetical protein